MARIDQVIVTVDVIDIHIIVVVVPVGRPRFGVLEIIAAVIKAAIVAALHVEMMFASRNWCGTARPECAELAPRSLALPALPRSLCCSVCCARCWSCGRSAAARAWTGHCDCGRLAVARDRSVALAVARLCRPGCDSDHLAAVVGCDHLAARAWRDPELLLPVRFLLGAVGGFFWSCWPLLGCFALLWLFLLFRFFC